jgi:hypothetical protein
LVVLSIVASIGVFVIQSQIDADTKGCEHTHHV